MSFSTVPKTGFRPLLTHILHFFELISELYIPLSAVGFYIPLIFFVRRVFY